MPVVGPTSFEVARHLVDSVCAVSEKLIAIAVLRLIETERLVVEGGGATALAALLPGGLRKSHRSCVHLNSSLRRSSVWKV